MRIFLPLVLLATFATACESPARPELGPAPPPPKGTNAIQHDAPPTQMTPPPPATHAPYVSAEERTCSVDGDCVLAGADCCGCNNGGAKVGVRKDRAAAYQQKLTSLCEVKKPMCIAQMSEEPSCSANARALCVAGTCEAAAPLAPAGGAAAPKVETRVEPIDAAAGAADATHK